jgi:hypothetical protein
MIYGPGEVPVEVGSDGIARVYRSDDALFNDETMASLNAKPIVIDHPDDDVAPTNWSGLSKGIGLSPRRGEGEDSDCLVVDLLVTDREAIQLLTETPNMEISLGYDADYEQTGPGTAEQSAIIFNHIALVERGRCGPRCAVGDSLTTTKGPNMPAPRVKVTTKTVRTRATVAPSIRKAFKDAENAALEAMGIDPDEPDGDEDQDSPAGDPGNGDTHIHIHQAGDNPPADPAPTQDEPGAGGDMETRMAALEASVAKIVQMLSGQAGGAAPVGDAADPGEVDLDNDDPAPDTKAVTTVDSAALATSYQETLALAEVLVPGFRMPTFDAAKPRRHTVDTMCAMRRKALSLVYATSAGQQLVNSVAGKTKDAALDLDAMDCKMVAPLFKAAAGAQSLLNNRAATGDAGRLPADPAKSKNAGPQTLSELNEFNAKYYAQSGASA